jgi:hypothetical protein
VIEWFSANKLVLNLGKTNIMKFVTNNLPYCALTIGHKDKHIEEAVNLKFLGIHINNYLNWKNHIDQIVPKLSAACYMVRQMYHICNNNTLKSVYFAYIHSIASYGIIWGGNSSNSRKIFTLQKRIIIILVGAHPRTSCRRLFKKIRNFDSPKPIHILTDELLFWGIRRTFRQIHQCIALIQEINTIFTDCLLTCLVFRKVHPTLASEFLTACHKVLKVLRMKRPSLK